ncbi:MAG: hydrogenase expression/formation protein HypE [Firmicutes bacterium]|nr:hydrogenase expression/formation protein HypE [Bacillota bacterium]
MNDKFISLAHGSGSAQTNQLINDIFKKHFDNPLLTADDAAVFNLSGGRHAFTTDGFIVSPYEFNGGNIGKLSVCGTVNDLACMGAKPLYMTCSFVIEEGFETSKLDEIAKAMGDTAKEVGVNIVAGDTKVAGKGQVDNVFITTSAIGEIKEGVNLSGAYAKAGDAVIVSGDIGRHGCCILLERNEFGMDAEVKSDCAPLWNAIDTLLTEEKDVHVIRDATRGGVGTVLYEIANQSNVGISVNRQAIPLQDPVKGVCGMLGLEPMYLACEGTVVIFAPKEKAENIVNILRKCKYCENTAIIGEVTKENPTMVITQTEIGTQTILPRPGGELLPRIC